MDSEKPTTSIQIRFGDGSRRGQTFNEDHTVRNLYDFVAEVGKIVVSRVSCAVGCGLWVVLSTFLSTVPLGEGRGTGVATLGRERGTIALTGLLIYLVPRDWGLYKSDMVRRVAPPIRPTDSVLLLGLRNFFFGLNFYVLWFVYPYGCMRCVVWVRVRTGMRASAFPVGAGLKLSLGLTVAPPPSG